MYSICCNQTKQTFCLFVISQMVGQLYITNNQSDFIAFLGIDGRVNACKKLKVRVTQKSLGESKSY